MVNREEVLQILLDRRGVTLFAPMNSALRKQKGRKPDDPKRDESSSFYVFRGMIIQPTNSQPELMRGAVVLLENSITVRISGQRKRMEVITQQLYIPNCIDGGWYTHQRSQT
ncbi:hypothetical protein TNCV_3689321 [Trichonephila clavipes]|uniref:Uncharacterized protein n=1 Tax=Trichonephila clavipes TaxID=2585209 RepID=A0A8X6SNB1_TRICX|nr:hypothetical protein TNCV_3689321 [Trichonephila clavipes]